MIIGFTTEYFTSNTHSPTLVLVESCNHGPAPNIIQGLALGYNSCIVPILCITATIGYAFSSAGMYGIGLSALGMLGSLPVALAIDGYGPISDNAGGIAEMSGLPAEIRKQTDALDAAGNTTAAVGKGFAIGSACLVGLALFGAFITRIQGKSVDILQPVQFAGLLVGAMLPYAFSALTMKAVGDAALEMMNFIIDDFRKMEAVYAHNAKGQVDPSLDYDTEKANKLIPDIKGEKGIFEGQAETDFRDEFYTPEFLQSGGMQEYRPDYDGCISISTEASLKMMVAPGILVIASPLVAGFLWGPDATAGLLAGAIVSGVQVAISASNTGGAWDNCKKEVEATRAAYEVCYTQQGIDMEEACKAEVPEGAPKYDEDRHPEIWANDVMVQQYAGEENLHMWAIKYWALKDKKNASVVGDTVGDPLKDTSGPAINILIKLSAITSLIFGNYIKDNYVFGNPANAAAPAAEAAASTS
jgi:inorganic pyrophosphatase